MPGEPIIRLRERITALETWRDEHKLQHDREIQRGESSAMRKVMLISALIGGGVGAGVSYVLSRILLLSLPS